MEPPPTDGRVWHAGAVLCIAALCAWRCFDGYVDPVLFGEDWSLLFVGHLFGDGVARMFTPNSGYVSVLPQVLGLGTSLLSPAAQAHALASAAGVIASLSLGWFASPRFAHLVSDARVRAGIAVLLAALPLADVGILCATIYAMYHLLFVFALMAVAATPSTRGGRAGETVVAAACAWSHPMAVACVPAMLLRACRERGRARWHYACLAALPLVYLPLGIDWSRPVHSAPGAVDALVRFWRDVLLPTLLLHESTGCVLQAQGISVGVLVVVPAWLGWRALRAREAGAPRTEILLLLGSAFAISAGTVLSRWGSAQHLVFERRYVYPPLLLTALWMLIAVAHCGRARPRLVAALLLVHAIALHGDASRLSFTVRPTSEGRIVAFAEEVAAWARRPGPPGEGRRLVLPGRTLEVARPWPRGAVPPAMAR